MNGLSLASDWFSSLQVISSWVSIQSTVHWHGWILLAAIDVPISQIQGLCWCAPLLKHFHYYPAETFLNSSSSSGSRNSHNLKSVGLLRTTYILGKLLGISWVMHVWHYTVPHLWSCIVVSWNSGHFFKLVWQPWKKKKVWGGGSRYIKKKTCSVRPRTSCRNTVIIKDWCIHRQSHHGFAYPDEESSLLYAMVSKMGEKG